MGVCGASPQPGGLPPPVVDWLLAGDPSGVWQTLRDLLDAPPPQVRAERAKVARDGRGAELLARQDPDGRWANGLYNPKSTSTTFALLLLHWLDLPPGNPQALKGCRVLWDGARCFDGGLGFGRPAAEPETCITALVVLSSLPLGYADDRIDDAVRWLLRDRLDDGG